ncbi:MAG TPA: hypothetical protein VFZ59_04635 [Verrucomicrobiae bacterium]|nr:hypothetical protein [Verrucomicrobiae bacterium]
MTRYSLAALALLAIPNATSACEPVIPLTRLLSNSTLAGPALLTESLIWLAVAVAIKSGVFAFFERRLAWPQAILFMLLANVVSTIPGILVGAFTGSGTGFGFVIVLPFVFFLGWLVQRRTAHRPEAQRWPRVTGGGAMLAFVGFFIASMVLYYSAENVLSTGLLAFEIPVCDFGGLQRHRDFRRIGRERDCLGVAQGERQPVLLCSGFSRQLHHAWCDPAGCCAEDAAPTNALTWIHHVVA